MASYSFRPQTCPYCAKRHGEDMTCAEKEKLQTQIADHREDGAAKRYSSYKELATVADEAAKVDAAYRRLENALALLAKNDGK